MEVQVRKQLLKWLIAIIIDLFLTDFFSSQPIFSLTEAMWEMPRP